MADKTGVRCATGAASVDAERVEVSVKSAPRSTHEQSTLFLPEELLLEIFKHHVASFHCTNPRWRSHRAWSLDVYGWLPVAHTCRLWRHIALSSPVLWTMIKVTSTACAETFFERSRDMPVSVVGALTHGADTGDPSPKSWATIFQHATRVQTLFLEYDAMTMDHASSIRAPFFPQLKHLTLTVTTGRGFSHDTFPSVLAHVHKCSTLETLETSYLSFFVASKLFSPSLRDLSLSNFGWEPNVDPVTRWTMLLNALGSLPMLESLRLQDGPPDGPFGLHMQNPSPAEPTKVIARPVALLNLRRLVVHSSSSSAGAILATLLENIEVSASSPPLHQAYRLGPSDRAQGTGVCPSGLSLLGVALGRQLSGRAGSDFPSPYVLSLGLHAGRHGAPSISIQVHAGTETAPRLCDAGSSSRHSLSTLTLHLELSDASPEAIFQHIFAQLPLERLQSLTIDEIPRGAYGGSPYMPSEAMWRSVFARAQDVRTLTVTGYAAEHLPAALRVQPGGDTPVLFPKLVHLKLDRVPFLMASLSDGMEEDGELFWVRGRWYETFSAALRGRTDLGKRLERLIITRTEAVTETEVTELESYVNIVTWDGRSVY